MLFYFKYRLKSDPAHGEQTKMMDINSFYNY